MRPFEFVKPDSEASAIELLGKLSPNVRILAGGTDYLVDLKHTADVPKTVMDISRLPELKGIDEVDDGLRIGAGVTHTEIMQNPLIKKYAPAMIHAAHTIGAVQTRNLGTIGGNLVTCVPSMDSGPTLVALDAEVNIVGKDGARRISLTDLFVGPRKTSLKANELLTEIIIPKSSLGKPANFYKFGLRKGQALALVNAASSLWVKGGCFKDLRISIGAVAPVVIRCLKAEKYLEGKKIDEKLVKEAGNIAVTEAKPIDDFRASQSYRNDLIAVLVTRTINAAIDLADKD